nr:MAG TPA: hypothetical protein [Caudoviricetes sp.]
MTSASTAHCSLTGYDLRVLAIGWYSGEMGQHRKPRQLTIL